MNISVPSPYARRWRARPLLLGVVVLLIYATLALGIRRWFTPSAPPETAAERESLGPLFIAHASSLPSPTPPPPKKTLHVSPTGSDSTGTGSESAPYQTIQHALLKARPGTHILVHEGTYAEYLKTRVNGKPKAPIVLKAVGPVILTGDATNPRIMNLWHDYYYVEGFEFRGKDVLLWLQKADHNVIRKNFFHHALGECVRIKYQSTHNIFERNRVEDCGLTDFVNDGGGKNGEGLYLGTAPEQLWKNPTSKTDRTSLNLIRNNAFLTRGNECVDIKEGSTENIVEFNDCTGQQDPSSGGLDARGDRNTFRYNKTYGNAGAGVRLGGDEATDGVENDVYGNEIVDNQGYAIKVMRLPQGRICGNIASGNINGLTNTSAIENPPCDFPLAPPGIQPE